MSSGNVMQVLRALYNICGLIRLLLENRKLVAAVSCGRVRAGNIPRHIDGMATILVDGVTSTLGYRIDAPGTTAHSLDIVAEVVGALNITRGVIVTDQQSHAAALCPSTTDASGTSPNNLREMASPGAETWVVIVVVPFLTDPLLVNHVVQVTIAIRGEILCAVTGMHKRANTAPVGIVLGHASEAGVPFQGADTTASASIVVRCEDRIFIAAAGYKLMGDSGFHWTRTDRSNKGQRGKEERKKCEAHCESIYLIDRSRILS